MISIGKKFFDQKNCLFAAAAVLIGFGRASAWTLLSPITACCGYACAFGAIASYAPGRRRFLAGWGLFFLSFLLQSSWFISHPYSYIIIVWLLLSLLLALPYAVLSLAVVSRHRHTLLSSAGLAAAFCLAEWLLTCLPCGYSFQSAALHLSWSLWPLQLASVIGALGLSFLVFWCNILVWSWLYGRNHRYAAPSVIVALAPYLVGGWLFSTRTEEQRVFDAAHPRQQVAVCHMEEPADVHDRFLPPEALFEQEWKKIIAMLSPLSAGQADLIVLPEGVAPYPADAPLFDVAHLPDRWSHELSSYHRCLSSLDLGRMVAASLKTPLLLGLEGREVNDRGVSTAFNSCYFILPSASRASRYDKQLLIPLGEYIPLPALRSWLADYGIHDSFSPGDGCRLFTAGALRICPLICYEETFSSFAAAAARLRPSVLVTLSNDCWYPAIRRDHFELARLRAVETGLPLVRSCNQGISGVVDAMGRTVACRGEEREAENCCFLSSLPQYTPFSLYAHIGPNIVVAALALLCAGSLLASRPGSPKPHDIEQPPLR